MKFVHLHNHTHYSLLDGLSKIDEIVQKAKADGMEAIAITDHGFMYGVIEFYRACKKAGIKPIVGVEVYVAPNGYQNKRSKVDETRYHLILLAKNFNGYKNLLKLTSIAGTEGFYYKPRIDLQLLARHSEGLIGLSGCLGSEIPQAILTYKDEQQVRGVIERYLNIFGADNFFFELQHHPNLPQQKLVNDALLRYAKEYNVRPVATADCHYLNTEDCKAHDVLLCVQTNHKTHESNRFSMLDVDVSFKTQRQMIEAFSDHPECIENTAHVALLCEVEIPFGKNILPVFDVPKGYTAEQYLEILCYEGLPRRYGGKVEGVKWMIDDTAPIITSVHGNFTKQDILDRLTYELSIINKTGFAAYFLIVADFINWAKQNGVVVGPGRGSAAGSLVAYVLRITDLDPLAYDLLFERFLNPERISMPDIDTDFADARRDDVMRYVEEKYGKDKVAQIATFGTMAARAAVRDVGRALGLEYSYCDRVAKMIPMGVDLQEAMDSVPELQSEFTRNPDCRELLQFAKKLEGVCRHASTHACGVLITPEPLTEYVPIQYASSDDNAIVSQYSLHPIEDLGLLKMDFLGLSNLTIIENALEAIEKIHGVRVDLAKLPLDDKKTYELLQRGETTGVFQLESSGMKRYLKQLQPNNIEDIIAMVALYRPGPMDLIPEYISNKQGKTTPTYLHPKLEAVLKKTHGIAVYQEQLMKIAQELAGFTLGEADVLRKAVGKKIKSLLEEQREKFVSGCVKNGVDKKIAQQIFAFIEPFAGYGFNRSHAACYAIIAYQTAYLKANYPAEFMAALLTSDLHNTDRVAIEVQECRSMGIEVLPPDVNESYTRFTVVAESLTTGRPRIRFGLGAIKNVGEHITKVIIHERKNNGPYASLEDFLSRIHDRDLNKKSLESLVKSGAMDCFGDRNTMLMNMPKILQFVKEVSERDASNQVSLFGESALVRPTLSLDAFLPAPKRVKLAWEKELLGLYISEHPFAEYQEQLDGYILSSSELANGVGTGHVRVAGVIQKIKKILTKKGEAMLFVNVEDSYGAFEIIVFPSVLQQSRDQWVEDSTIIVSGTVSAKDGERKVICNDVKSLSLELLSDLKKTLTKLSVAVQRETKNMIIFFKSVVNTETVTALSKTLQKSSGAHKVFLAVPIDAGRYRKIETNFHADFNDRDLQSAIHDVAGVDFVKLM